MDRETHRFMSVIGQWLRGVVRREELEAFDEGAINPDQSYYISLYHAVTELTGHSPTLDRKVDWAVNFPKGESLGDMARKQLAEEAKKLAEQGLIPSLDEIKKQSARGPISFFLESGSKRKELK